MTIAKVEVERFSLTSLKPFDTVVAALKSAIKTLKKNGTLKKLAAKQQIPAADVK